MSIPKLETERLLLREWAESDTDPFAKMNCDPEVMKYFPKHLSYDESKAFIQKSNSILSEKKFGLWAVEIKNSKEFIGFIGLAVPTFEARFMPCTEIGWRLKASAWGHGYASEGARQVLQYAFVNLGMNEVVSFTAKINEPSWKVMERIGMKRNAEEDFDHPKVEKGHLLERHVLYRIRKS